MPRLTKETCPSCIAGDTNYSPYCLDCRIRDDSQIVLRVTPSQLRLLATSHILASAIIMNDLPGIVQCARGVREGVSVGAFGVEDCISLAGVLQPHTQAMVDKTKQKGKLCQTCDDESVCYPNGKGSPGWCKRLGGVV